MAQRNNVICLDLSSDEDLDDEEDDDDDDQEPAYLTRPTESEMARLRALVGALHPDYRDTQLALDIVSRYDRLAPFETLLTRALADADLRAGARALTRDDMRALQARLDWRHFCRNAMGELDLAPPYFSILGGDVLRLLLPSVKINDQCINLIGALVRNDQAVAISSFYCAAIQPAFDNPRSPGAQQQRERALPHVRSLGGQARKTAAHAVAFNGRYIFLPISERVHFGLMVADRAVGCVYLLDPLFGTDVSFFAQFAAACLMDDLTTTGILPANGAPWRLADPTADARIIPAYERQHDGISCGIYTIFFMQALAHNRSLTTITDGKVAYVRLVLACALLRWDRHLLDLINF